MPSQTMLRTLNMNQEEAVTCIWNLCEGPNPLDLSAGYSKSGGGPLICDVDSRPDGLFGPAPPQLVLLAIAGGIFFYTGLKLATGVLYRHRLENVLRRTFDGATISNGPVRGV